MANFSSKFHSTDFANVTKQKIITYNYTESYVWASHEGKWDIKLWLKSFFTLALDGDESSGSLCNRLKPSKRLLWVNKNKNKKKSEWAPALVWTIRRRHNFLGSVTNLNTIPGRSKLYFNHHTYGLYQLHYCTCQLLKHMAI